MCVWLKDEQVWLLSASAFCMTTDMFVYFNSQVKKFNHKTAQENMEIKPAGAWWII